MEEKKNSIIIYRTIRNSCQQFIKHMHNFRFLQSFPYITFNKKGLSFHFDKMLIIMTIPNYESKKKQMTWWCLLGKNEGLITI